MIVKYNEMAYKEGATINDYISNPDTIDSIRKKYRNNCVGAAEELVDLFMSEGYLATMICFKREGSCFTSPISIWDEINKRFREYSHHAVVLMGEWVIDILHTDKCIKTSDYIDGLLNINDSLRLDSTMSSWYNKDGYLFLPTIEYLQNYRFEE